jgi:glutathione S-transferase
MKGEHLDKEFQALNPQHCVPTIVDDDLVLWESRAIMQYITNRYAKDSSLYPTEAKARANVDFWLNWDMGSLYAGICGATYPKVDAFLSNKVFLKFILYHF